ncbi:SnoaL-like domain containing protein [Sphingomonadaceae bacterium]|jgi:ketosteroid isomerase-like protein
MYAHVQQGDWDIVENFFADDFLIYEPPSLPYGGEWHGKDALRRLYAHVMAYWEAPKVEWIDLLGSETYTVALLHFSMTSRASGERFSQHVTEVTRFNSYGKMTEMRIHYFDAGEVARIAGPDMKSI